MDTETIHTTNNENLGDGTMGQEALNSGSRTGFGTFIQSFADDGFYVSAGFHRTEGDYDFCAVEDCVDVNLRVDDVNVEFGWSNRPWTPFLDISCSNIESNLPATFDSETDSDLGIGSWYHFAEDTTIKIKISGLSNNDNQAITAGFQRTVQNYFTIDGSFTYPLTQDVTGFGFRFAVGWTFQP